MDGSGVVAEHGDIVDVRSHPARAIRAVASEELEAMRVVTHLQNDPPEVLPPEVMSLIVPIAYDLNMFGPHSIGVSGRCSFCPDTAETMAPRAATGRNEKQRWLAFCQEHDHQRHWVRVRRSGAWWYLPPPKGNEREHWWKLAYSLTGCVGGRTGWYLHKATGDTTMDLCTKKLYRARALAERYFAVRAPGHAAVAATKAGR